MNQQEIVEVNKHHLSGSLTFARKQFFGNNRSSESLSLKMSQIKIKNDTLHEWLYQ